MVHLLKLINDLANDTQFELCRGSVQLAIVSVIGPMGKEKKQPTQSVVTCSYQLALDFAGLIN